MAAPAMRLIGALWRVRKPMMRRPNAAPATGQHQQRGADAEREDHRVEHVEAEVADRQRQLLGEEGADEARGCTAG